MTTQSSEELKHYVGESLSLALLCAMNPAGISFETYKQTLGLVRYTSLERQTTDLPLFIRSPLHMASEVIPTLSDLVAYEMSFEHGLGSDGWLEVIATYPFVFVSYAVHPLPEIKKSPEWDLISDISFTNFIMLGGKSGIDNDIIGYVISQESNPGAILESSAFRSPTSVIAPGYTHEQIDAIRESEILACNNLMTTPNSILSSFVEEITTLGTSGVQLKFLYGVSTTPFNNIDKVITHIGKKAPRRTKKLIQP